MANNDDQPDSATLQMSTEEVKRLHAELAGRRASAPAPADVEDALAYEGGASDDANADDGAGPVTEEQTVEDEAPEPVVAKRAMPAKAANAAAPKALASKALASKAEKVKAPAKPVTARPLPVAASGEGGGAMLVLGGVGAILVALGGALSILPMFQGMTGELWAYLGGLAAVCFGHFLLGLGMFGAVSRTSGIAALVGTLHILAFLGLAFYLLAALQVFVLDNDLASILRLAPAILPGTAWMLSAMWAFASTDAIGTPVAVLHGLFAFIGGGAGIAHAICLQAGVFRPDDDIAYLLQLTAPAAILLAATFLAVAMFGRLRSASANT